MIFKERAIINKNISIKYKKEQTKKMKIKQKNKPNYQMKFAQLQIKTPSPLLANKKYEIEKI